MIFVSFIILYFQNLFNKHILLIITKLLNSKINKLFGIIDFEILSKFQTHSPKKDLGH